MSLVDIRHPKLVPTTFIVAFNSLRLLMGCTNNKAQTTFQTQYTIIYQNCFLSLWMRSTLYAITCQSELVQAHTYTDTCNYSNKW